VPENRRLDRSRALIDLLSFLGFDTVIQFREVCGRTSIRVHSGWRAEMGKGALRWFSATVLGLAMVAASIGPSYAVAVPPSPMTIRPACDRDCAD